MSILGIKAVSEGKLQVKNPSYNEILKSIEIIEAENAGYNTIVDDMKSDETSQLTKKQLTSEQKKAKKEALAKLTVWDLPDGTKGPLEISMVGRNSKQWLDYLEKINDANLVGDELQAAFSLSTKDGRAFVASLIVGWLDNGALTVKYTPETALELVNDPENLWLSEQLLEYATDQSHFFLKT